MMWVAGVLAILLLGSLLGLRYYAKQAFLLKAENKKLEGSLHEATIAIRARSYLSDDDIDKFVRIPSERD